MSLEDTLRAGQKNFISASVDVGGMWTPVPGKYTWIIDDTKIVKNFGRLQFQLKLIITSDDFKGKTMYKYMDLEGEYMRDIKQFIAITGRNVDTYELVDIIEENRDKAFNNLTVSGEVRDNPKYPQRPYVNLYRLTTGTILNRGNVDDVFGVDSLENIVVEEPEQDDSFLNDDDDTDVKAGTNGTKAPF